MIFLYLFITFFEIGLFGFGGGYGMLSLIQHETVEHWGWLSSSEFTDIVAISQMTPVTYRHKLRHLLWLYGNQECRLWSTTCHPRFGNGNLCTGIALADSDDTDQQDVHEIYELPPRTVCIQRTATSSRRTPCRSHLIIMYT